MKTDELKSIWRDPEGLPKYSAYATLLIKGP